MSTVTLHGLELDFAGFSEQGPRSENQDAFAVDAFLDRSLLALADGMGGEKGGRVAADTALDALRQAAPIRTLDDARRAVRDANEMVERTSASDPDVYGGMGCALGLLSFANNSDGPGWIAAHVGDVRILSRSPDGLVRLETRDHTPAFARWEAGEIGLDEIPDSTGANRLQRAVGRGGEADVIWLPAGPGWSWLIVSDGIYKAMRLDELAAALASPSADDTCEAIRRKVAERGADDNYTAVVARILGGRTAVPPPIANSRATATPTVDPMPVSKRSGSGLATALALAALILAGLAFWTTRSAGDSEEEMNRLRMEVDSLRAVVGALTNTVDPLGPTRVEVPQFDTLTTTPR